jgi:uncharacterized protein (TIGR02646 family)
MHKLDRSVVTAPSCLSAHDFRTQSWDELTPACKASVRTALLRMQGTPVDPGNPGTDDADFIGVRCAYCEGQIRHEPHIEHFRRKSRSHPNGYPELTFAWGNLFLSCASNDHCGHYKDHGSGGSYEAEDLIKPDEHEPDAYLYFHSTGEVRVRGNGAGMAETDLRKAEETVRVFNLNSTKLVGARARAVANYLASNTGILDFLLSCSPEDRQTYVQSELAATRWDAHSTVIKHWLERRLG